MSLQKQSDLITDEHGLGPDPAELSGFPVEVSHQVPLESCVPGVLETWRLQTPAHRRHGTGIKLPPTSISPHLSLPLGQSTILGECDMLCGEVRGLQPPASTPAIGHVDGPPGKQPLQLQRSLSMTCLQF